MGCKRTKLHLFCNETDFTRFWNCIYFVTKLILHAVYTLLLLQDCMFVKLDVPPKETSAARSPKYRLSKYGEISFFTLAILLWFSMIANANIKSSLSNYPWHSGSSSLRKYSESPRDIARHHQSHSQHSFCLLRWQVSWCDLLAKHGSGNDFWCVSSLWCSRWLRWTRQSSPSSCESSL